MEVLHSHQPLLDNVHPAARKQHSAKASYFAVNVFKTLPNPRNGYTVTVSAPKDFKHGGHVGKVQEQSTQFSVKLRASKGNIFRGDFRQTLSGVYFLRAPLKWNTLVYKS